MEKQFCSCGYKSEWYAEHRDREPCPRCQRLMFRMIDEDANKLIDDTLAEMQVELELEKRVAALEAELERVKEVVARCLAIGEI